MNARRMLFAIVLLLTIGVVNTSAQTRIVTGTVTDALSNDPIVGATVTVEGTTISTLTGPDGTFTLGAPPGAIQIVIRIIGYKRTEVAVGANQSSVAVPLAADVLRLDEIVVSGQATGIDRRNLPNGISTVSAEEMSRAPAESVERILAGRVAGANIQTNSGAPGGGISVELRGTTSFISRSPLYVVDGVIMSDVAIPSNINEVTDAADGSNPSLTQDNQVNRIADLNPADIETVEILKGASASAIYGSKASNGVIIITTKRGQAGRPRIQMNTRFGFFDLDNTLTRQFNSAQDVDAVWGPGTAEQFNFDPNRNVERDLAGRNALSFEVGGSVSGGNANTQYFVSGVWKEDEGIMENTGFDKQSVRINLNQAIGDRIRLSFSTNLVHTLGRRGISNNDNSGTSPWFVLASTPRLVDLTADQDGTFPSNSFERSNPIQTMALMKNDEDVWRMVGALRFEADLIRHNNGGLQFLWSSGVDRFSQENSLLFPPELQFEPDDGLPGTSLLSNSNNVNINLNGNLVYRHGFNNGRVTTTTSGGLQYETRELNVSRVTTRNLLPNQSNINQGSTVSVAETKARVEDFGLYIQEEVLIDERLLLTAGIRGDQSSANTQDDKLFWFPKAAASYRIPINGGVFEEIKLRGAYGESGNQPLFGAKFSPLENPTLRDLQLLAQGVIIGGRGAVATRAGYVSTLGILGRESYNFDPSDPRFLTGLLEGPLDGSSNAFGGGHWVPRYANIRNANILIASIDRAPSGSVTSEQGDALRGFAKTMAAHDLLLAINTRDDFGAPIDVAGEDPTGDPPPIVAKDDVLTEVVRLLDEGAGHLDNGGSSFPFVMPSGFSGFDTPAAFKEFNRAILARTQAYRGNWSEVNTSLQGSFIDDVLPLGMRSLEGGLYHSYSAGPGDVVNNLFDPSRLIIVAHPSTRDEAQAGDARLARKIVDIAPVSDQASRGVTTDIAFDIYDALSAGVPYIRNEELILLRAEARLQTNDLPGSLADINLIRTVSGSLPPIAQSDWDSRSATDRLNELLYNRR